MNKKKIIIGSIISVLLISCIVGVYIYFTKQDKTTSLTVLEKKWIENNKNDVIDLSIVSNVPVFNYEGEGVFFDFINSLEKDTGLRFNKLSYSRDSEPTSDYAFEIVDKADSKDILIYEDNYVIITKNKVKYNNLQKIETMVIGVLEGDLNNASYYLGKNKGLSFKTYNTVANLLAGINNTTDGVDAIILPKTIYLKEIVESEKFNISYDITEMKKYFVLKVGNNKKLNKILSKYYKKWYKNHYEESFTSNFSNNYFAFKQIYEQEKVNFRSKRYSYGFVEYAPFDSLVNNKLVGFNNEIIKEFSRIANIEISYNKYKSYSDLLKAFNENKIDFYLNASSIDKYSMDVYNTVGAYDSNVAILSKIDNDVKINSEMSLDNFDVLTLKNSKVDKYLTDNKISTKTYDNLKALLKHKKNTDIIVVDKEVYDTHMYSSLKNYRINYLFNLNNTYNFVSRDIKANEVFNEYFDFYLSYLNVNSLERNVKYTAFQEKISNNKLLLCVLAVLILAIIISTIVLIKKLRPKRDKITVSKEDKLKYIDMLTSLKNRNYLNDSIEKWDNSGIYPQAIVIVDLNNVAYINDNYGHEEGDNIIKEAASILFRTQIENTELIRTNGNEFLIYMIEYEEKQVVSYIRKLNKELKELNHGFGAAVGYSMINDELKTVDDAINEATLDMRNNKEEIQN